MLFGGFQYFFRPLCFSGIGIADRTNGSYIISFNECIKCISVNTCQDDWATLAYFRDVDPFCEMLIVYIGQYILCLF